ncbi:hypothetical protein H8E07_18005 [bacterium]|nr:hypothetical protein [bacterium]
MRGMVSFARRGPLAVGLVLLLTAGCGGSGGAELIGSFSMDDADGLLDAGPDVTIDADQGLDGGGSLHIFAPEGNKLVNIHEFAPGDFDGDVLSVLMHMKSEMLGGDTSFDLWIFTNDSSPRRIRRLCADVGRTKDWQKVNISFPLVEGEEPVKLRTAVHLEGRGHLWIDNLEIRALDVGEAAGRE